MFGADERCINVIVSFSECIFLHVCFAVKDNQTSKSAIAYRDIRLKDNPELARSRVGENLNVNVFEESVKIEGDVFPIQPVMEDSVSKEAAGSENTVSGDSSKKAEYSQAEEAGDSSKEAECGQAEVAGDNSKEAEYSQGEVAGDSSKEAECGQGELTGDNSKEQKAEGTVQYANDVANLQYTDSETNPQYISGEEMPEDQQDGNILPKKVTKEGQEKIELSAFAAEFIPENIPGDISEEYIVIDSLSCASNTPQSVGEYIVIDSLSNASDTPVTTPMSDGEVTTSCVSLNAPTPIDSISAPVLDITKTDIKTAQCIDENVSDDGSKSAEDSAEPANVGDATVAASDVTKLSEGTSDVTKLPSDATEGTSDVTKLPDDATEGTSDVTKLPDDATEGTSDVTKLPDDATEGTSDVTKLPSDATEVTSDVNKLPHDATEGTSDVAKLPGDATESANDVTRLPRDDTEGTSDVTESANDVISLDAVTGGPSDIRSSDEGTHDTTKFSGGDTTAESASDFTKISEGQVTMDAGDFIPNMPSSTSQQNPFNDKQAAGDSLYKGEMEYGDFARPPMPTRIQWGDKTLNMTVSTEIPMIPPSSPPKVVVQDIQSSPNKVTLPQVGVHDHPGQPIAIVSPQIAVKYKPDFDPSNIDMTKPPPPLRNRETSSQNSDVITLHSVAPPTHISQPITVKSSLSTSLEIAQPPVVPSSALKHDSESHNIPKFGLYKKEPRGRAATLRQQDECGRESSSESEHGATTKLPPPKGRGIVTLQQPGVSHIKCGTSQVNCLQSGMSITTQADNTNGARKITGSKMVQHEKIEMTLEDESGINQLAQHSLPQPPNTSIHRATSPQPDTEVEQPTCHRATPPRLDRQAAPSIHHIVSPPRPDSPDVPPTYHRATPPRPDSQVPPPTYHRATPPRPNSPDVPPTLCGWRS